MTDKELSKLAGMIADKLRDDELLDKKRLCKEVLHCDTKTFDRYYAYEGVPVVMKGTKKMYPRKAVETWLNEQVIY